MEGIPEELIETEKEQQDVAKDKPKCTSPHKRSIMVIIRTREDLCVQKKGLDYQGTKNSGRETEGPMLSINGLQNGH